jgi:GNAT superfamily N-acetyltransferase
MKLELQRFDDPDLFREATGEFLTSHIESYSHLYGLTRALTAEKMAAHGLWLTRLHRAGVTCGVAAIAIPMAQRPLSVTDLDDEGAALVAVALAADGPHLDAVIGGVDAAYRMAACLGADVAERVRIGNHVLDGAPSLPPCAGSMRAATAEDVDLVLAWEDAFVRECGLPYDRAAIVATVRERLGAPVPLEWLWEVDGRPVAKAFGRPMETIARIAQVYTPLGQRGRGYAGALVGSICSTLRAQGCRLVFLSTDMANPTSNGVYRRIGFRFVGEAVHLDLVWP